MTLRDLLRNFLFFSAAILFVSFMQVDTANYKIQKITATLESFIDTIHPQKIYLHIDKNQYFAGEKIRFNSYLVDGVKHRPDSVDKHLYVELLDPYKRIVQILRIKQIRGIGSGEFTISDTVPAGIYQVRAYTNRMKNFGPEFYFNRNINVCNPYEKYLITSKKAKINNKNLHKIQKEKSADYISFFPEGGQLLTDINCKVAFKATDGFGNSIDAKGEIFNNKKKRITSFTTLHNGMGYFYLKAEKGETYYSRVSLNDKPEVKISLPIQIKNAVSLQITEDNEFIALHILSNKEKTNDRSANEFVVIGQERGKVMYSNIMNLLDQDTLVHIKKEIFSTGVVQFTLINNRLQPVSERLYLINNKELLSYSIEAGTNNDVIDLFITPRISGKYTGSVINASAVVLLLSDNKLLPRENIISE
jgi:hypothetical protein